MIECPTSVTCCPPDEAYDAAAIASHNAALVSCAPLPNVSIDPPSGTMVMLPTLVILSCDRPDAVIYYTTNGIAPDSNSQVYSSPFSIESVEQPIQAIGIVPGCGDGPTAFAQYVLGPEYIDFSYSCDTTDKVGQWGDFTPNGAADYHWLLQLVLSQSTDIKRIEIYQTNAAGLWNSGQAWSTAEFISPIEGPASFHVFPLKVFDVVIVDLVLL